MTLKCTDDRHALTSVVQITIVFFALIIFDQAVAADPGTVLSLDPRRLHTPDSLLLLLWKVHASKWPY